jgi:hypothetical protein
MTELSTIFSKDVSVTESVKALVLYEAKLNKELKQIKKFSAVYSDEISEQKANMHITKDGSIMFIPDMENSHLINTVKMFIRNGFNLSSRKIKKYIDEVKKRGLVNEIINEEVVESKEEEVIFDDFDDYNTF